ncbi:MAG: hypothetical protein WCO63_04685 [Bacteroidota bacterium]
MIPANNGNDLLFFADDNGEDNAIVDVDMEVHAYTATLYSLGNPDHPIANAPPGMAY